MASSTDLERMKEELKATYPVMTHTDELRVALLEEDAWALYKAICRADKKTMPLRRYFFAELGDKARSDRRGHLLGLREWAKLFWEKIASEQLPLSTAYKLALESKSLGFEKGISSAEACAQVWEAYNSDGHVMSSPTGRVYRKRPGVVRVDASPVNSNDEDWNPDVSDSKKFHAQLRLLTTKFIDARLEGLDPSIKKDLSRDFEYELRVCYEDLLAKIQRHRKDLKQDDSDVSFSEVRQACECLDIPVPKRGEEVDMLDARTRYRKLAARFHPDRNGGDHKLVRQYQAVNEAWQIIQRYMEGLEEK
jgi:hypothetical protein